MNYQYYKQLQKKEMKKNFIFITFILILATVSTYLIYTNVKEERDKILKMKSLEVTYHEKTGNKVTITKLTPVTDYVGLASTPYTFTIKNNTNSWVKYKVKLVKDNDTIKEEECSDTLIPLNLIKVGIHEKGEVSKIYNLDDIEKNIIAVGTIAPRQSETYTVRVWVSGNIIATDKNLHYHGLIKIEEN